MTDDRLASIRAQIDAEDAAIIAAIERRNWWVKKAQEGNAYVKHDHLREHEIYQRYRDNLGYAGMTIATAVLRAGREAVRAVSEERHTSRDTV